MINTIENLKKIKVDALYGKKKHFNAADRKEKYHLRIGIPLIVINFLTGSVLLYVVFDGLTNWSKYIPIVLAFIATVLSGFQTNFNFQKKVEGHRRVANRYLSIMKKCNRNLGYISDSAISDAQLIKRLEEVAAEMDDVNKESESYPTNRKDYEIAQKGIKDGEEIYTDTEKSV